MKLLITVLVFILSLQFWTKADDIRDFQIEGISIGDSALDHFTEEKIKNGYTYYYNSDEFVSTEISIKSNLYRSIHIHYRPNDGKYILQGISATIIYKNNINECYKKKNEIVEDISELFSNIKPRFTKTKHQSDKSKKSTLDNAVFTFENGDVAIIACYDWSKEVEYVDHLRISLRNKKFTDFINK